MTKSTKPEKTTEAKPEATETKEVTVDHHAHPHHNLFEGAKDVARALGRSAEHIVPHLGEICAALLKAGIRVSPKAQAVALGISAVAAVAEEVRGGGADETPAPSNP